jgi:hypothetical protein
VCVLAPAYVRKSGPAAVDHGVGVRVLWVISCEFRVRFGVVVILQNVSFGAF